jgi:hypothetical protein
MEADEKPPSVFHRSSISGGRLHMLGKIVFVRPVLRRGRLCARVTVQTERSGYCQARLPERELAALVPRSLLVCGRAEAPLSLLGIISSLLKRTASGRRVRVRPGAGGEKLVTFMSWKNVRFQKPAPRAPGPGGASGQGGKPPLPEDAEGHGHIEGPFGAAQGDGRAAQARVGERERRGAQAELLRADEHRV